LDYNLTVEQRLAKARASPVDSGDWALPPTGGEQTWSETVRTGLLPLLMSVGNVAFVTGGLLLLERSVAVTLVPIAYLIPVVVAATKWGIWPSTLASIASMAAADFFFFPPIYSLQVEDPQEAIDLLLLFVVALVSSNLASRLRRETEMLRQREREIQLLFAFSQRLAACFTISDLISAIETYLSTALGSQGALFVATANGHFERPHSAQLPKAVLENVASMSATVEVAARTIVDPATEDIWLLRAVSSESTVHGVIAVSIGTGSSEASRLRTRRVEALLEEVSLTLRRLDIGKAIEDARLHLQAELLRDAFHGTLSHELCSPLAAIQGSASVLSSVPVVEKDKQARALVDAISEEVVELDGYIRNLLSATRVTAGGLKPRLEWTDPRDLVTAAIKRTARRLEGHKVETAFADDLPLLELDSGLIEEATSQLLQNAAKYSPTGSTISVRLRAEQHGVILSVADQGVGITPDEQEQLGRRSFRSRRHRGSIPGSGLGFWIASTFVSANGGTMAVASPGPGLGTTVSISLPVSQSDLSELTALEHE
jgi:K+-sensing histidine kinase KdpD